MNSKLRVGFIGAGTVGTALAVLLDRKGYGVVGVYSRTLSSAEKLARLVKGCRVFGSGQEVAEKAGLVFITTPDAAIPAVVSRVKWPKGVSVVHCSGADSTDVLEPAMRSGAMVGSFHPLQTFAGVQQAIENIPGSTFAIEAGEPLLTVLKYMATALDGSWIKLQASDKVLYHAAAVFACNYLVTLVKMATDLWQTFSIPTDQATRALLPLLRGTLHNIETIGIPQCLTGPIARGDDGTVSKHLKALKEKSPALLFAYQELGLQTVPIALAKGKIAQAQASVLEMILKSK
ncbi:MAG: hypothetical protein A2Z29_08190 [Chloroflexi bacterium RBG_16_56_11]|nr:MAG: hypothetical protein A2Z29_08190 [Chloroflexi bacterium RBG_16_56_11]